MQRPPRRLVPLVGRSIAALLALAVCVGAAPDARAQQKNLTLEQTMGPARVNFGGAAPHWSFASDGVHLVRSKEGKSIWVDPVSKAESEPPPEPSSSAASAKEDELVLALSRLSGFDEVSAKRAAGGRRHASADGSALLLEHEGDLFYFHFGRDKAMRLTFTPAAEELAEISPDGRFASFVRESNLFLVETEGGRERQVTKDGGPDRLNGKLDWVYQEEVYGRGTFKAHWWSPSSRHVAFLSLDEAGVPHHPIVDQMPMHPEVEDTRYPKSGDPNPKATLMFVRARDGRVTSADLGKYAKDQPLVVRVDWTPDGKRCVFEVQDREQTWLDLDLCDPDTGQVETLFRDTSHSWVNVLELPRWLADGTFLWLSERTGYKHVFQYDRSGKLLRQITDGPWEVRSIQALDEAKHLLWFTASKDSAVAPNLYRIGFDGSGLVRLTQGPGSHSVDWNPEKSLFLDRVSSVAFPPEVRLCKGEDGSTVDVLGKADVPALKEYRFSIPELLQIPARDGFKMDATLIKPPDFDASKRYPIWLPTYSGPDAPSVADAWRGDPWTQFLAQQGYLVFQVNNRTSSQRGLACIEKCYQQFGVQELADLEDAIAWLGKNSWADTTRVGISGWSFGGFMTAYALTHSKAFKLGVAGAGVYDWKLYDSIYTERYMKTPQNNPEGYKATSCIEAAGNLAGYLVLAHGAIDDNVHFQNTIQFAMALQSAGKDFDLMVYPRSRHGLSTAEQNWHFRKLTWKAMRERL